MRSPVRMRICSRPGDAKPIALLKAPGFGACGRITDWRGDARRPPGPWEFIMKRVLFVGQEPETVDFSDSALPPGLDAEKIRNGIASALRQMSERGWQADLCLVRPDESASGVLKRSLEVVSYDCVVIGGGIRIPPNSLLLFETLVNTAHKSAPGAAIAFNTNPEDTAAAAARWIEG